MCNTSAITSATTATAPAAIAIQPATDAVTGYGFDETLKKTA
jgi:hypothetical protein